MSATSIDPEIVPVTPDRWDDLEALFGERGACAGCWCMYWRREHAEYEAAKGAENRAGLHELVAAGDEPGLLATVDGEPAGWVSVAPRVRFPRLARSRILEPVDDEPVWSIVCFFVDKDHRGRGLSVELLEATKDYVREHGGSILEGYPIEPSLTRLSPAFAWVGLASAFETAGFEEVARRSATRPIMRFDLSAE